MTNKEYTGPYPVNEELWKEALTLGSYILKLVKEKKTKTPEFQTLVKLYGETRLRELYLEELKKERGGDGDSSGSASNRR